MSFMKDFKAFAMKGSVVDLAVGVVIGGAFGKIVTALVNDVIMPLVALLTGKGQLFESKFLELPLSLDGNKYHSIEEAKKAGVNVLAYGDFIQSIVDFVLIALSIFVVIRLMSKMRRKEDEAATAAAAAPPAPTKSEELLTEIRDLLKK
jgi:large conductance mechanosensitive channel